MNEERLRQVVHDVVAKHLRPAAGRAPQAPPVHSSHARYVLIKVDDACVIEPSVGCNHCGYCESHGH